LAAQAPTRLTFLTSLDELAATLESVGGNVTRLAAFSGGPVQFGFTDLRGRPDDGLAFFQRGTAQAQDRVRTDDRPEGIVRQKNRAGIDPHRLDAGGA